MEAEQALAFVARRAGTASMDGNRWRHVMSLELGWMPPGQAGRYVEACRQAGLLVEDEGMLRLSFDPKGVQIPRGFRPDPEALPAALPTRPHARPAAETGGRAQEGAGSATDDAGAGAAPAVEPPAGVDLFSVWLPKVAAARRQAISATLEAVEQQQAASGGLLHAEPALLRLGAEAGLDVRDAARQALSRLRA